MRPVARPLGPHLQVTVLFIAMSHLIMVTLLRYLDAGGSLEECVVDMVNSVEDGSHPSSRFPVPAYYK